MNETQSAINDSNLEWLTGGGEMGDVIRSKDWSKTSLGPLESWPASLRTTVSLCLASNFPINIIWGPQHIQIYNDGYRVVCGAAHPRALGESYTVTWASAWPAIGKPFEGAIKGETNFLENQRMFLERNGYFEETFFTFSLSPIRDETGKVVGLFHPVTETTARMLAERRVRALKDISSKARKEKMPESVCVNAAKALEDYPFDLSFSLCYLLDDRREKVTLAASSGITSNTKMLQNKIELKQNVENHFWPFKEVLATKKMKLIENVDERFGPFACGDYPEVIKKAFIFPLLDAGGEQPTGVIVLGVSPRLSLDDNYQIFYEMLASTISTAINEAQGFQEERKRAEALAEIDKAKTTFFSNVSHEFRTPLTLMLGPLEDLLAGGKGELLPVVAEEVEVIHRNSLRLLKLVNTLLEFSRLEANREKAYYEATDLPTLTEDIASNFRSAIERAGVKYHVHLEQLSEPVFVDREMWEKIVLNLLSNAFKYTLTGEINVILKSKGKWVELSVVDSGAGISKDELPKIFQRFHRVHGSKGRNHEGTGIGLALVQELVNLHGGRITVTSEVEKGSTFTVQIPKDHTHLPKNKVNSHAMRELSSTKDRAKSIVSEATNWLEQDEDSREEKTFAEKKWRIILADDNADMRHYIRKLLIHQYEVIAVENGKEALDAARAYRPDLILSDIMMPVMDGIEFVKTLRKDPLLHTLPVILLSARAGEEAKASGIEVGADDYLTKPFSAKELLARVKTQLHMAEIRQKAIEQEAANRQLAFQQRWLETVLDLQPTPLLLLEEKTGEVKFANQAATKMAGGKFPLDVPAKYYNQVFRLMNSKGEILSNHLTPGFRAIHGEKIQNAELIWETSAGHFTLLVDSEKVPSLPGQPSRIILCLKDVSQMKEIQTKLEHLIYSRDEFLSIASHELKTPLTALKLQLQITKRKINPTKNQMPTVENLNETFKTSLRQVESLIRLVDDLLDVSRVRLGKLTFDFDEVNLSDIVKDVLLRLSGQLDVARCSVETHLAEKVMGYWDRVRLEQVISNLITNAIKYAPGSKILLFTDVKSSQRIASFVIQDNGAGIPPAKQKMIFERFERAVEGMSSVSGLGLGLFISKGIIEAHHGSIIVESEEGRGTKFVIELPLQMTKQHSPLAQFN
jgi:signal transduction histidine kinase/DNA-binding response OmpR family regulator